MQFMNTSFSPSFAPQKIVALTGKLFAGVVLLFAFLPINTSAQGEKCGAAKDLVVQGLEHIKTGTESEVADGLQLLKHANEVCPTYGLSLIHI